MGGQGGTLCRACVQQAFQLSGPALIFFIFRSAKIEVFGHSLGESERRASFLVAEALQVKTISRDGNTPPFEKFL